MPRRGGARAVGVGVFLLAYRIFSAGVQYIPPVTLALIALQSALFLGFINPPWSSLEVCLSAASVLEWGDYTRLLLAALEHTGDLHLYYNMSSLLMKGSTQERRLGSRVFLMLMVLLTLATSTCYVGLMEAAARYIHPSYRNQCALGFSGVLFALKVVTTYHASRGYNSSSSSYIWNFHVKVPTRYAVWVELLVIHLLVPRSSFVGHLAGILVGIAYVNSGFENILCGIDDTLFGSHAVRGGSYASSRSRRAFWGRNGDDFDDYSTPEMHYQGREEEYRTYSREDFNPSRNFEPMFTDTSNRRRRTNAAGPSAPSAPSADDVQEPAAPVDPSDIRTRRLQRFQ
ncbi:Peptidase S54 rhomboid domain [Trinorchestia longiramus]|nr:Peptidase S54 rhomboid domain [Trinorchestia longiramus]